MPYDQGAMWKEVVGSLTELVIDAGKARDVLGVTAMPRVDASTVGMVAHSRSGMMVDSARELFGADALKSVFAYGPAYDTFELESISPASADLPYLAVVGELDSDVGGPLRKPVDRTLPARSARAPDLRRAATRTGPHVRQRHRGHSADR